MQAKWIGRPVRKHENVFDEIRNVIPCFDREPFTVDGVENDHLDMIIKRPVDTHDDRVPVATVSKSYSLVQHHDVLTAVETAFKSLGYDTKNAACSLQLTEDGERMWLRVKFAEAHTFDPGDGQPLILEFHALNSVDRSTVLTFEFGWYRLVCSNGMMRLNSVDRFQRRHTASLCPETLVEYLDATIEDIEGEKETCDRPPVQAWGFRKVVLSGSIRGFKRHCFVLRMSKTKVLLCLSTRDANPTPHRSAL